MYVVDRENNSEFTCSLNCITMSFSSTHLRILLNGNSSITTVDLKVHCGHLPGIQFKDLVILVLLVTMSWSYCLCILFLRWKFLLVRIMILNIHYWLTVYNRSLTGKSKEMIKDRSFLQRLMHSCSWSWRACAGYALWISWSHAPKWTLNFTSREWFVMQNKDGQKKHSFPTRRRWVYVMQEVSVWSSTRILLRKHSSFCMLERTWDSRRTTSELTILKSRTFDYLSSSSCAAEFW